MRLMTTVFGIGVLAAGIAAAASTYDVKLYDSVWVGSTELKKGDYKVEMKGDKAVFMSGKNAIEVPATVSKSDKKFGYTRLETANHDGMDTIEAIDLEDSNTRVTLGQ